MVGPLQLSMTPAVASVRSAGEGKIAVGLLEWGRLLLVTVLLALMTRPWLMPFPSWLSGWLRRRQQQQEKKRAPLPTLRPVP